MDFNYSEEEEAVRQLAAQIFGERSTHDRLKEVEAEAGTDGPIDRDLYRELANAGLLGIHLGDEFGGAGLDFVAACLVIEAAGRTAAYVPVVETMVYGALPIARFGTDAQRKAWLPGVGRRRDHPDRGDGRARRRSHRARWHRAHHECDEARGRIVVPLGHQGLCPRRAGGRRDPGAGDVPRGGRCGQRGRRVHGEFRLAPGLTKTRQSTTTGRPEAIVELDGVVVGPDRLLGDGTRTGAAVITFITEHATTALCIQEAGACASALELTAEYTKTRVQFDKPIATFQAVGQRAADAYVDTEAIRLTAWQAASRLGGRAPRLGRGGHRQVLGGRGRPARRPRGLTPPRRRGGRPRLPLAPLLLADRADRAHPRRRQREPAATRPDPGGRAGLGIGGSSTDLANGARGVSDGQHPLRVEG